MAQVRELIDRYSPDVLAAFRAMGTGWQAKMDDALREWLRTHNAA